MAKNLDDHLRSIAKQTQQHQLKSWLLKLVKGDGPGQKSSKHKPTRKAQTK